MSTSSNMVLIETKTVGAGGSSTIDFTGIPTTGYTDLQIVFSTRSSYDNIYVPWTGFYITANASSTGYSGRMLEGNGSSAYSQTNNVSTAWEYAASNDSATTSNTFSSGTVYIPNYAGSTYKSMSMDKVTENNATGASLTLYAGLWSNTAAISRITFTDPNGNFVEGSTASLYGIKSASKVLTPKATGGIISTSGNYVIHTFTASGTFTPTADLTNVEYLVIAGGGGGGENGGAGGGAGGYRSSVSGEASGGGASAESKLSFTASTGYPVVVGAGGGAAAGDTVGNNRKRGADGGASSISTISCVGGGGGGAGGYGESAGRSGGSGGGGAAYTSTQSGGSGTANQGYAGGSAYGSNDFGGAGGGGAGSAASNASNNGTVGGAGITSSITGVAIARASGGSGYRQSAATLGGGGADGQHAQAATGGGGGQGGNGGSGIVIVRYVV